MGCGAMPFFMTGKHVAIQFIITLLLKGAEASEH
jgi:hypothetical protein